MIHINNENPTMPRSTSRLLLATCMLMIFSTPLSAQQTDPAAFVDPFIGTGGHGHTFP